MTERLDLSFSHLALSAIVVAISLAVSALAAPDADASARATATKHAKAELVETVPIARNAWQDPRVVMAVKPSQLGDLKDGDRIEATGEVELTVCLKPGGGHPGQPCVGELYGYSPKLKAKMVIAPTAGTTSGSESRQIGRTKSLKCRQDHPRRNHHCVISIPWGGEDIGSVADLPCAPGSCFVNMIVSAHNGSARDGERVVVGSSDDNKRVHQGLAKLSVVRYRPGETKPAKVFRGGRARRKATVVSKNSSIKRQVLYSAKVKNLKAGDQLVVDGLMKNKIGHLPYNVFQRTEIVFAKKRKQTGAYGKVLDSTGRLSASNGFNCTQKKSAHSDTCTIRKGGVISIKKNAKGPFFVNFVVGQHAIGMSTQYNKWRSGDRSKVLKGGYVKVERYAGGSGACSTCSTGWTAFSAQNRPNQTKPAKLVSQLSQWGINNGTYDCGPRPKPVQYACNWRSQGRYGNAPKYECSKKAQWWKKGGRFIIKPCKEAMAAQLWDKLLKLGSGPIAPEFVGACKDRPNNMYRCKYIGEGASGMILGKHCKGYGTYDARKHSWSIDPCRP